MAQVAGPPSFQGVPGTAPALLPAAAPMMTQVIPEPLPLTQSPVQAETQDLKSCRSTAEFTLRDLVSLQRRRQYPTTQEAEDRIRNQGSLAVRDLRAVRKEVSLIAKEAEAHRWRKWVLGSVLASFIPIVRRLFRRQGSDDKEASNDTEYAFIKSKSLLATILNSVSGSGVASITFFVFAVMYVFTNEVKLRVARTLVKRLRKLGGRVEGGEELSESDLKVLKGWRWRVLL